MKPHRVRMTHNLLMHYGLHKEMEVRHLNIFLARVHNRLFVRYSDLLWQVQKT